MMKKLGINTLISSGVPLGLMAALTCGLAASDQVLSTEALDRAKAELHRAVD